MFPSLKDTQLLFLAGEFLKMEPAGKPLLTLIPPSMFGPPEKVHVDWAETEKPGVLDRPLAPQWAPAADERAPAG
jgi:hypothetical protein